MPCYFFKIFYFAMAVISIVALCKIFAGQVYTWDLRTLKNYDTLASTINSTSWPYEMRLRMTNYVCTTPAPDFNVTEEELIAAWLLSHKTRLSDRMREIARCHLAAERMSSDFDPSKCDCVDSWPIGSVVPLILNACFYSFRFGFGLPMDKSQDVGKLYWISNVPCLLWLAAYFSFNFNFQIDARKASNIGIFYTSYGHTNPSYYFDQSVDWIHIIVLLWIGYFASVAEVHYRALMDGRWARAVDRINGYREWFFGFIDFVQARRGREEGQRQADADRVISVVIPISFL